MTEHSDDWRFFQQRQDDERAAELAMYTEHGRTVSRQTDVHTIGDLVRAILAIDNDEDAARLYRGHVEDIQTQMDDGKWEGQGSAVDAAKSNIGWCYGEGMAPERIEMWRRVTGAVHPVFGAQIPTDPAEMLAAGRRAASA